MDQGFLRDVQKAGWIIFSVTEKAARVQCPRHGCKMKFDLVEGKKIPSACEAQPETERVAIDHTRTLIKLYRSRREALGLTIKEVEEMAGAAVDFFAKAEKDNPSKIPNHQTMTDWGTALGIIFLAELGPLPPMSLRYIAQSRNLVASRTKMQAHHRARREGGEQSGQE